MPSYEMNQSGHNVSITKLEILLLDAVMKADAESLEALARAGPVAVKHFRDWLTGEGRIALPLGRGQEFVANTTELSCFLAARFPDQYLAAFNNARWIESSVVLEGLGCTKRAEARKMLIVSLTSQAPGTTRLRAAAALAEIPSTDSMNALLKALDDTDYLVRDTAIWSLGIIGDKAVLDRLLPLAIDPPDQACGLTAAEAVKALSDRLGVDIDPSRIKLWPAN